MNLAKRLISEAKKSGAHCVKFQSWTKDSVLSRKKYEDNYFLDDDYRDRTDYSLEQIVDAYSMSEVKLMQMKDFAKDLNIDFASTPFCNAEADFLVNELQAPFVKVASMDLKNYPFLTYLASKKKPLIISTGLSELSEIDLAVRTIEKAGNNSIILMHCVSTYPPEDKDVNLRNITTLMSNYPDYPVGFSDHTIGCDIPLASVALGACIIEKHFTLDKSLPVTTVSATPDELTQIVNGSLRIHQSLGSYRVTSPESERQKRV